MDFVIRNLAQMKLVHHQKHDHQLEHHQTHECKSDIGGKNIFYDGKNRDYRHKKQGQEKIIFNESRLKTDFQPLPNPEMHKEHQKIQYNI